ncbi:MAG: flagellar basal body rod protein FlgB [bacterium]
MNLNATTYSIYHKTCLPAVARSLDASMLRSKAIANNIANVNTVGYERVEVKFEEDLKKALNKSSIKGKKTKSRHLDMGRVSLEKVKPKAYKPEDPSLPSGVNNVDIDAEAAKLAETQILFNYGVRFMQQRNGAIFSSIKGVTQKF